MSTPTWEDSSEVLDLDCARREAATALWLHGPENVVRIGGSDGAVKAVSPLRSATAVQNGD